MQPATVVGENSTTALFFGAPLRGWRLAGRALGSPDSRRPHGAGGTQRAVTDVAQTAMHTPWAALHVSNPARRDLDRCPNTVADTVDPCPAVPCPPSTLSPPPRCSLRRTAWRWLTRARFPGDRPLLRRRRRGLLCVRGRVGVRPTGRQPHRHHHSDRPAAGRRQAGSRLLGA